VRDFVNIMFVLVLLAIAIANIVGSEHKDFQIKSVLPKIIIGLIAVNFSFLACKVIIDVSNVAASAIFAMPTQTNLLGDTYNNLADNKDFSDRFCGLITSSNSAQKKIQTSTGSSSQQLGGPKGQGLDTSGLGLPGEVKGQDFCIPDPAVKQPAQTDPNSITPTITGQKLSDSGRKFFTTFNSRNVALIIAVDMMQVTEIVKVDEKNVGNIKGLTVNTIFAIIFFIIYATAFVALFIVLLLRIAVLWITTCVMPIAVLGMVFEPVNKKVNAGDKGIRQEFMKAAILPVPISIVLSLGIIMITQVKKIAPNAIYSTNTATVGAIVSGTSTLQDLIAGLGIAMFIWIAVFEAIGTGRFGTAVNPIKNAVAGFAKSTAKLPLYVPFIPTDTGKSVGIAALGKMDQYKGPQSYINSKEAEYSSIFASPKEKALSDLEQVKDEPTLRRVLPGVMANYDRNNEGDMKRIADVIEKNFKGPFKATNEFADKPALLAALRAKGGVDKGVFQRWLDTNSFAKPDSAKELDPTKQKARDLGMNLVADKVESEQQVLASEPDPKKAATTIAKRKGQVVDIEQNLTEVVGKINPGGDVQGKDAADKLEKILGILMKKGNDGFSLSREDALAQLSAGLKQKGGSTVAIDTSVSALIRTMAASRDNKPKVTP